jgi:AraC-like DNA-binding protein
MSITEFADYSQYFNIELYEGRLSKHKFPIHYHDKYTVVVVEEGEMVYNFSTSSVHVSQGEAFIINPFEPHYNIPGAGGCLYKAMFLPVTVFSSNDTLSKFPKRTIKSHFCFQYLQKSFHVVKQLIDENSKMGFLNEISSMLNKELVPISEKINFDNRIQPALNYINAHLNDKLLIHALAKVCLMSTFHFQRVFKSSMGLTVQNYIQQQRTEYSKQRIIDGYSPRETTYDTGYFDHCHFHKAFKKMWAVNPSHFSR